MSRGLGRTQRAILRYLTSKGPDDVTGIVLAVYPDSYEEEPELVLGPIVRRSLYRLRDAGLVRVAHGRRTRTGSISNVWAATGRGEVLVGEWDGRP